MTPMARATRTPTARPGDRLLPDHEIALSNRIREGGGQGETLHACYGKACLGPIEQRLRAGRFKITGFFPDVRVLAVAEDEVARWGRPEVVFMNVNTPDDLARARALAGGGEA